MEQKELGGEIRIIIKNFVEKDEFRLFMVDRERGTVKKLQPRSTGGRPLLRTEFESEMLKFLKGRNKSRRRRVPN